MVTERITDDCMVSNRTRERGYLFPLYVSPDTDKKDLFSKFAKPTNKTPNLSRTLLQAFTGTYGRDPDPEAIFHYIYAILYTPIYRTKYAEFLKSDFPRIPFTRDKTLFTKLGALGKKLREKEIVA